MSTSLNKKRIWITRPKEHTRNLCQLIENAGGKAIVFPTIKIKPIIDSKTLSDCFNNINQYDYIIFISRNAVKTAFDYYLKEPRFLTRTGIVAIGAGTAEALTDNGVITVQHAGLQADTETLLKKPELQARQLRGKRILIIQGVGGRQLLAECLLKRGANVEYAAVYHRCLPEYGINDLKKRWRNSVPDTIITTSNDGLQNLLRLTLEDHRQCLLKTPLVLMSNRAMALAKEMGFSSDLEVATDKNDQGLLTALLNIVGDHINE